MYHDLWGALSIGFLLDLLIGDPKWLPHPVQGIGKLITYLESRLYREEDDDKTKIKKGTMLVAAVSLIVVAVVIVLLLITYFLNRWVFIAVESIMCWQLLSVKGLGNAGMKVYRALKRGNMEDSRAVLSEIVGRDTWNLDKEHVIMGAVESVSENTVDGVVSPIFWLTLGGPVLGWLAKTVSTLDSMIGYKNERYNYFGRTAAKMDDMMAFIPARIGAALMMLAVRFTGLDHKGAVNIYKRDRKKSESPNSGQCESVCAGALGIRLLGPATYDGVLVDKPYIGDETRKPEEGDVKKACGLMYETGFIMYIICTTILFVASRF